jgi:hypothetical protein
MKHVAMGFRVHSGWVALVALGGPVLSPTVVRRERLGIAESRIPGSLQPYHAAKQMAVSDAEAFIGKCARAADSLARSALQTTIAGLAADRFTVSGCSLLTGAGRPASSLESILASHAMIHTAEGELFRNSVKSACEACGLPLSCIRERDLFPKAESLLRLTSGELKRRISDLGAAIGPPWRADQKLSALAAWLHLR